MRRRHVPNETAALKCLYLTIMILDPTGQGRRRTKPALNAFAVTFSDRFPTAETH
jgi:putative transposase